MEADARLDARLGEASTPFGLITRGPLIVRDLDVLEEAGRSADVSVTFSVPTLDHGIWRLTEPGTATPPASPGAAALVGRGIRASVGMAPILPGSRTVRTCWRTSSVPRGMPARPACGRTSCTCGRHSRALPRPPRQALAGAHAHVRAALRARRYVAKPVANPSRARVGALARAHGIADRREVRVEPPPTHRSGPTCRPRPDDAAAGRLSGPGSGRVVGDEQPCRVVRGPDLRSRS